MESRFFYNVDDKSEPFHNEENVSDDISEALMRGVIRDLRASIKNPQDYTARTDPNVPIEEVAGVMAIQNRYSMMARWHEVLFPVLEEFTAEAMDQNQKLLALPQDMAREKNATLAQLSLAWMLCKKPWIVPIPGTRKLEQLRENAGAADVVLTPSEVSALDDALDTIPMSEVFGGSRIVKNVKEESIMEYVTLNNGIKMPMAGIGTFLLTPDEAEASVLNALACGYRLIDTANAYVNEKAVGRAMKKSGVSREEIFLETKLWPAFYEQSDAVEKTLERLDTDYIDLLLIHQPAGNYIAGYKLMEKAYKEGKVKAIGLSNFSQSQIREILDICEVKPVVLQTEVHPYYQEKKLKDYLKKEGIVIQAWYPLGHGDKALLEEPLFQELGKKYGKSSAQIILHWHIQAGNIVIPGSKSPAHIQDNFDLFDFSLTAWEMAQISIMDKNVRYYTSTPELLQRYAAMVPPVDEQK